MGTQEEITRYANISQIDDDDFLAPFLSGSQNTSMPIQESCSEVEIVTSNPTIHGGNFSVDEDNLLISAWLNISMNAVQGTVQGLKIFGRKFGNTFVRTIITEPHVLLPPSKVDGEILIGRQVGLLGSWLKLKPEIQAVRLMRTRFKLYCNGVTIIISE